MNISAKIKLPSFLKHAIACLGIINRGIVCCFLLSVTIVNTASAQTESGTFGNLKTTWRGGYDRYDFLMDTATLIIKPIKATENEQYGMTDTIKGQVRCILIMPKHAATGNPWCWRGFYWDHQPQYEVELLNRGFYIGYINCDPGKQWDAWYKFLIDRGLSAKPAFGGMSRGGINAYAWSTTHPDKVSCIYGDNPAIRPESMAKMGDLAKRDIPLLNVCGSQDFLYETNTLPIETIYHQLNGRITVLIKEGTAHHPHSLQNPTIIADWIEKNIQPSATAPDFIDSTFTKSYYYSLAKTYKYLKEENTYATCSGPGFTPCYDRYDVKHKSFYGTSTMVIIIPNNPAPGKPWIFRSDRIDRDAVVDQELLAKGYYIVVTPLTEQSGADSSQWNATYKMLIAHGFAKKAIMEGTGASAGEAYAWAIQNPDKVSCIYTINPVMRNLMSKTVLLDNLAPLAKAGIPLLNVCGSEDPWLQDNTRIIEKRYQQMGGHITIIVKKGEGHFLTIDPQPVVDFITKKS
ncbi:alpha/beta fold hydrolase [Mucilaginibacter sp. L196]|uniref:alpha/beta fold hydrolase n=1 Tax=Mucilaginibacter sp. L196 TaxID=1641870 RepID=UPI00131EBD71|nr:alpha/beta hydrolase [Mucilaginibacter sp. L196]